MVTKMNSKTVKKCAIFAAACAVAYTVTKLLQKITRHRRKGCTDTYPDVENEGHWEDPDIEREFETDLDEKKG